MKKTAILFLIQVTFLQLCAQDIPVIPNNQCGLYVELLPGDCDLLFVPTEFTDPDTFFVQVDAYPGEYLGIDRELYSVSLIIETVVTNRYSLWLQSPSGKTIILYYDNSSEWGSIGTVTEDCSQPVVLVDTASTNIWQCDGEQTPNCAGYFASYGKYFEVGLDQFNDSTEINGLWSVIYCSGTAQDTGYLKHFNLSFEPVENSPSSIQERFTKLVQLQPNPGNHSFRVSSPLHEPLFVQVFNATGQLLYQNPAYQPQQNIETTSWPQGLYLVHLQGKEGQVVKKWIKE